MASKPPQGKAKLIRRVKDLTPHDKNANVGTAKGKLALDTSLADYGVGRSIVADREGRVIAGNKTLEAAQARGIKDVVTVRTKGEALIVHQREDLDLDHDPKAIGLAIADNRVGELDLKWDFDVLRDAAQLTDLKPFFTDRELGMAGLREAPEPKFDKAEELVKKWGVARGAMYELETGKYRQRVLCGDACEERDLDRLMGERRAAMCFTDPPWNVAIGQDSNPAHRQREGLENDDLPDDQFFTFLTRAAHNIARVLVGDIYLVMAAAGWPMLDKAMRVTGFHWSTTLIWVKDSFVLGRSKYQHRYEPIWYGWHSRHRSSFDAGRAQDDVWELARPKRSEAHPTMKPVELVERAIENSSVIGEHVLDVFGGAGSTACAALNQGRSCYTMEIEPKNVAIILERLADMGARLDRVA